MKFKTTVMTPAEGEVRDVYPGKVSSTEDDGTLVILDHETRNVLLDYAPDEWTWVTTEKVDE